MSFIFHNNPVKQALLLLFYQMKKVRVKDSKKPAHSQQLVGSKANTRIIDILTLGPLFHKFDFTIDWLINWLRERERKRDRERASTHTQAHEQRKGRGRGRRRIPSRFHALSTEPHAGLNIMNCKVMTWAEIKSQILNWLSHPDSPNFTFFHF